MSKRAKVWRGRKLLISVMEVAELPNIMGHQCAEAVQNNESKRKSRAFDVAAPHEAASRRCKIISRLAASLLVARIDGQMEVRRKETATSRKEQEAKQRPTPSEPPTPIRSCIYHVPPKCWLCFTCRELSSRYQLLIMACSLVLELIALTSFAFCLHLLHSLLYAAEPN